MDSTFTQITTNLLDLMVILHKKIFNPLVLSKATNLTPAQFSVLFFLTRHDNSSVSEVAGYLQISKPNMTPILDSLIGLDYIERVRDPRDRRVVRLHLTPGGHEFFENLKSISQQMVEEIFQEYKLDELKKMLHHSTELLDCMSKISGFEDSIELEPDEEEIELV